MLKTQAIARIEYGIGQPSFAFTIWNAQMGCFQWFPPNLAGSEQGMNRELGVDAAGVKKNNLNPPFCSNKHIQFYKQKFSLQFW